MNKSELEQLLFQHTENEKNMRYITLHFLADI